MSIAWTKGNQINQNIKWELQNCKENLIAGIFDSLDVQLGTSLPTSPYTAIIPAQVTDLFS